MSQAPGSSALAFDGSSQYASLGLTRSLDGASFTLETWFNWSGGGAAAGEDVTGVRDSLPLISMGQLQLGDTPPSTNFFLGIQANNGKLSGSFRDERGSAGTKGDTHPIYGKTKIETGVWHHAALTYDGQTLTLYLDGQEDAAATLSGPVTPRTASGQQAYLATALTSSGEVAGFFQGAIDEARVWGYSRSQTELQQAMNQELSATPGLVGCWGLDEGSGTRITDSSGYAISGETVNNPTWVAGAPFDIAVLPAPAPNGSKPGAGAFGTMQPALATGNTAPNPPVLVSPTDGATGVASSPNLSVTVSDPNVTAMTVNFYGRAAPASSVPDFTIVALPDTQKYSSRNPGIFTSQTQWIVNNRTAQNIVFVTHLGDIVDDWNTTYEWDNANAALTLLDNAGIPYGLTLGNCDEYGYGSDPTQPGLFNNYFPASRYQGKPWYGGAYNGDNRNSYQLFSASGLDFIIFHLEYYSPSPYPSSMLNWVNTLIQNNSSRRAIITTHFLLDTSNAFSQQVTDMLPTIKARPNLFLMLGGHLDTAGRRQDPGTDGHLLTSLRSDYQADWDQPQNDNGYLRIMRFSPTANKIFVTTYSPYINQSFTDGDNQFALDYNMGGTSYQLIGTKTNVASGSTTSLSWPGLSAGTQYQWYATASDGTSTTTGATWSFTTASGGGAPVITTQPAGQTVNAGQMASFTAAASGTPTPTVQWQVSTDGASWSDISGATSTAYSLTAQSADNGKLYHAVFTNTGGSTTSSAATLTVYTAPVVTAQPANQTVTAGQTASFSAAASGYPTPTVQWLVSTDGNTFNPISGATGTTYSFTAQSTDNNKQYLALFTNAAGSASSSPATLTVNTPPAVTTQPASQTVMAGQTASFSAAASGSPVPTIQWQVNPGSGWSNISGATSTTYSFTTAAGDNGEQYRAVFTNSSGSATSNAATLTVNSAPSITSPNSVTFTVGTAGSFTMTASGYPAASFSEGGALPSGVSFTSTGVLSGTPSAGTGGMYPITITASNGISPAATQSFTLTVNQAPAITSATSATFVIGTPGSFTVTAAGFPSPTLSETGTLPGGISFNAATGILSGTPTGSGGIYPISFTANNAAGSVSQSFTLTVNQAPTVTTQPASQTVNAGQNASFSAAANGYPAPSIQWQVSTDNGTTWNNVSGATSATYSFLTSAGDNGKQFRAVFTNTSGSAASSPATLTLNTAPAVTSQPASLAVTAGSTATFTSTASGSPAPTVQWQVSTDGINWTAVSGATSTTYSFTTQAGDNGKQYRAVFTNSAGTATSNAATLTIVGAPVVTAQPASQTVNAGQTASFTAAASGTPTPTVQWQVSLDGSTWSDIPGATSTIYAFTAQGADNGKLYHAVFTNSGGSTTSQAASLTVYIAPAVTSQPANLTVSAGQTGSFTAAASGNPAPTVQWQMSSDNGASWGNISGATSLTYTTSATQDSDNGKQFRAVFTNTAGSATSAAATLTVNLPPAISSVNNTNFTVGTSGSFTATAAGRPTPFLSLSGTLPSGVTFSDNGNGTASLSGTPAAGTGKVYNLTLTAANIAGTSTQGFSLTVNEAPTITSPATATFTVGTSDTFTMTASGYPASSFSETGLLPQGLSLSTSGVLSGLPSPGTGGSYLIVINASNGVGKPAAQSFTLTVNQAPTVTTQPSSQTINPGQTASFTTAANGYPAPAAQWQMSLDGTNWGDISGATSATYFFTAQTSDTGKQFRAVFTNTTGSATSSPATLTVNTAPAVTSQPANQTVNAGSTATFTSTASGSPAPTVQWQVSTDGINWTAVSGATSTTYSFTTQAGDNGKQYRAVFTNSAGSATSNAATLTVQSDLIFKDGFDSCSAINWTGLNSSPLPQFSTSYGRNSTCGMSVTLSSTPRYVTDPSPAAETRYNVRFYFNPNTVKISKNDTLTIFNGYNSAGTQVLTVQLHTNNGKTLVVRAGTANDSGAWSYTGWINLSSGWQAVEVDWLASSSASSSTGSLTLYLKGSQVAALSALNNDIQNIDTVSLGLLAGGTSTTSGIGYFDDFESRRGTYIGP